MSKTTARRAQALRIDSDDYTTPLHVCCPFCGETLIDKEDGPNDVIDCPHVAYLANPYDEDLLSDDYRALMEKAPGDHWTSPWLDDGKLLAALDPTWLAIVAIEPTGMACGPCGGQMILIVLDPNGKQNACTDSWFDEIEGEGEGEGEDAGE